MMSAPLPKYQAKEGPGRRRALHLTVEPGILGASPKLTMVYSSFNDGGKF